MGVFDLEARVYTESVVTTSKPEESDLVLSGQAVDVVLWVMLWMFLLPSVPNSLFHNGLGFVVRESGVDLCIKLPCFARLAATSLP